MSSTIVITLAVIGGIAWLGFLLVAALRRRGPEEIPSNLSPGTTDDEMETRRLETGQKTAVLLSAFLAVSLPLYFLGEQDRQEGFVEQFDEESVERGAELVTEYGCFSACHGPDGTGGVAPYVEKRSGVEVSWVSPSLNDVFLRYEPEEVNYWITYGRGNTPMPAWGLDGGGPMNEEQVQDVVNYLQTIQIPQEEVLGEAEGIVAAQAARLTNAQTTAEDALVSQRQVLAEINASEELAPVVSALASQAREVLDTAGEGIDTDGDGLSDAAEAQLVEIGQELRDALTVIDPVMLDPENAQSVEGTDDLATAQAALDRLTELVESGQEPILVSQLEAVRAAVEEGAVDPEAGLSASATQTLNQIAESAAELGMDPVSEPIDDVESAEALLGRLEEAVSPEDASEELTELFSSAEEALTTGRDPDADQLSTASEQTINNQIAAAIGATTPAEAVVPNLDPTNPATTGEPDAEVASRIVAGWEGLGINLSVTANNIEGIRQGAQEGVEYLENALEEQRWQIDIEGVAEAAFDGDTEQAERAVYLFNGYCARCHTAGFSAGVPYTLEAGSGGFGPALWDGRPIVQFGEGGETLEEDLLFEFIVNGSEDETPYGLNGFGSGRMPAFGRILSQDDISLIVQYLRGGDLTGMADEEVGPGA